MEAGPQIGELRTVARVSSPLADLASAPKQGDEGAPEATVEFVSPFEPGLRGIAVAER